MSATSKRKMVQPTEEDADDGKHLVTVRGETMARELHAAAIEVGPHFGAANQKPIPFDSLPERQRNYLVATCEHVLRKRELR